MTQKSKFISKTVQFGGKQLTLYSLDGCTWSTRKDELKAILERHEAEKVTAAHLRGEVIEGEAQPAADGSQPARPAAPAPKKKFPIGGYRKQPIQLPHPAYAANAPKNVEVKAVKEVKDAKDEKKQARPAAEAKAPAKKAVSAAPKAREMSKPKAKKAAGKKRAVA